jgi:uncharacterized membrane protein (DUF373 family)
MMLRFEKLVFTILAWALYLYVAVELVELAVIIYKALSSMHWGTDRLLLSTEEGRLLMPIFFNILIAMELAETMKEFHAHHQVRMVRILTIGIIAIGRKLIVVDFAHGDPMITFSLAALVGALVGGVWLLGRCAQEKG